MCVESKMSPDDFQYSKSIVSSDIIVWWLENLILYCLTVNLKRLDEPPLSYSRLFLYDTFLHVCYYGTHQATENPCLKLSQKIDVALGK